MPFLSSLLAVVHSILPLTTYLAAPDQYPISHTIKQYGGPIFRPPSGPPNSEFFCDYSRMPGWHACSTVADRSCWLENDKGDRFDTLTDYEDAAPLGVVRNYNLVVNEDTINADGLKFLEAKVFNGQYPGPWIEACWGDTVRVTVKNQLNYNGTSVHWHGIRQNQTNLMDGVNGVTQCAIPPQGEMVYEWHVTQYGSTWYHSHFSVQYADGGAGPITLHGPSSDSYDLAPFPPLIMTDWGHNSAFEAIYTGLDNPSIIINGRGNITRFLNGVNDTSIPEPFTLDFAPAKRGVKAKRYLLYLINASFSAALVFSIDNHQLTVVEVDFIPVKPFTVKSLKLGIGQRYHVIVEAAPTGNSIPKDCNFWIRATVIAACENQTNLIQGESDKVAVLRYEGSSPAKPTTKGWPEIDGKNNVCQDETFTHKHIEPIFKWLVGPAANGPNGEPRQVSGFNRSASSIYPLARWSMLNATQANPTFVPLRIDYSDPTILHLSNTGGWPTEWVVVPEDYKSKDWAYLVIEGSVHPIHLHGHDFGIVYQSTGKYDPEASYDLNLNNPPRRDVIILPTDKTRLGFAILAFRTDNPGPWLMHCHIAFHAAGGLALQILERREDALRIWPDNSPIIKSTRKLCYDWNKWEGNCNNWWPGDGSRCPVLYQDDSGI